MMVFILLIVESVLPSGFEPESKPREGLMIGRTTLREQYVFYPPEATCIIVISWLSYSMSSIGMGLLLLITIRVFGLSLIFFSKYSTVDPVSTLIFLVSLVLDILAFISTWNR